MKFSIGTTSKIKLEAAHKAISLVLGHADFEVTGFDAKSGVSDTPWNEETLQGAVNRAQDCKTKQPEADYWIGLESGLIERYGHVFEEAWACVISKSSHELLGFSSGLKVPEYILKEMKMSGEEHREVMKRLRKNADGPKDTWGDYSAGVILRTVSLEESLRNALIQEFAPEESYYHAH